MNREHLKQVIFEQREIIRQTEIIPRKYTFEPNANYVLTGMRRAGKSTCLYHKMQEMAEGGTPWPRLLYVNFEDERLAEFTLADFNDIILVANETGSGNAYYFFDEIQNVTGWEKFARRMADAKERVCITGSNARMLSREIEATLGARYLSKRIHPYDFAEYLRASRDEPDESTFYTTAGQGRIYRHFTEYLHNGGLPEALHFTNKREYISSVYGKILLGDILTRNAIRNDAALRILCKKIAESVCNDISYSRLHNIMSSIGISVSKDTVIEYAGYMQDAYLIFAIRNYFAKFAEREGNPKFYFEDNGVLNLFLLDRDSALLENVVAVYLHSQFENVYYLKSSKTGIDVDFYIPDTATAIQVTYTMQTEAREREIKNLAKLAREMDEVQNFFIVTLHEEEEIVTDGITIQVVPAWKVILNKGFQ